MQGLARLRRTGKVDVLKVTAGAVLLPPGCRIPGDCGGTSGLHDRRRSQRRVEDARRGTASRKSGRRSFPCAGGASHGGRARYAARIGRVLLDDALLSTVAAPVVRALHIAVVVPVPEARAVAVARRPGSARDARAAPQGDGTR